ncbi:MAG: DoxX family protein [Paenibacillaceae bacterium]
MDILSFILQGLLALMFLMAGLGKITGSKMHVEGFKHWRLPQGFRVVTGIVEFVGAVALIIGYWEPSWAAAGALLLGVTAIGGILTHIRVNDSFKQTAPIVFLGILAFIVFFIRLSDLSDFPGFN